MELNFYKPKLKMAICIFFIININLNQIITMNCIHKIKYGLEPNLYFAQLQIISKHSTH